MEARRVSCEAEDFKRRSVELDVAGCHDYEVTLTVTATSTHSSRRRNPVGRTIERG